MPASVNQETIPFNVNTTQVRLQQRKTVKWSRESSTTAPWSYEFSLTSSGKTKIEAEQKRNARSTQHEFEIELNLLSNYTQSHGPEYLARSLLLKASDFLASQQFIVENRKSQTPRHDAANVTKTEDR